MSYYEGKTYWIAITTVTGLLVGLIRFIIDYPDDMPGIFKEILSFHVDPKWAPATYIISAISLGGGACLGPEQAMVIKCFFFLSYSYYYSLMLC